jgi:F-type H+-transporting ATPase subunit a
VDIAINLGGERIIQPAVFNSVVVVMLLCIFFVICGAKISKADPSKPSKGLVFFMEFVVSGIDKIAKDMIGDKGGKFAPFIGFLIFYLLSVNLLGLTGLTTPTSNYNVTLSLALFTLTYIAFSGVQAKGLWGHLKDTIFGDVPALFLLNIIGEGAKVLSLSFRLFGNILSGTVMIAVTVYMLSWLSIVIMPGLSAVFNIFAGVMQTLIFCILTMVWLSGATSRSN